MIRIHPISGNKKQYLDLLLLADEQESMIDRYLDTTAYNMPQNSSLSIDHINILRRIIIAFQ